MQTYQLYHNWFRQIMQLRPNERITTIRNFTWLIVGIYQSKSVHLSKIASKIPGKALLLSITRRINRFLENPAVHVREWYEPIAIGFLERVQGEIRLIVDGSKVGFGHQFLVISLAYRRRALPLVWMWIRSSRGHSSSGRQLAMLGYIKRLLPAKAKVLLVGDSEFGAVDVLKQLEKWGWKYVLRQKGKNLVRKNKQDTWKRFDSLINKTGQRLWFDCWKLTGKYAHSTNLLAYWKIGEKEPWLLATNLPSLREALAAYKRRMWIEEMFGDMKGNGFDLKSTHLRHFMKINRLTLAVVLLYVSLVAFGSRVIKNGQRRLVDRADRRDLSIFRIGWYMLERLMARSLPFSICFDPYFKSTTTD